MKSLGFKRVSSLLEKEWGGISEQDLLDKLKALSDGHPDENIIIFKDDESNVIVFDTVEFEIESGGFKQIKGPFFKRKNERE